MKLILNRYYTTQKALDDRYEEVHKLSEKYTEGELVRLRVIALLVEMGECLNEHRGFKFWSLDQAPRAEKLLEEYVDGLHFILSIGNSIDENEHVPSYPSMMYSDGLSVNSIFVICMQYASMLYETNTYEPLLQTYLDFGYALGFKWNDVEEAYFAKNKINHERQTDGY